MTTTQARPGARPAPNVARLSLRDLAGLASIGLRTRKLRAALSALGIAIGRLPGVTAAQDIGNVGNVGVFKSPLIPSVETNGLSVDAATLGLPAVVGTSLTQGQFLNAATAGEPVAVLGAVAAQLLGIDRIEPGMRILAGSQWFYVTGILRPDTYAPEIDSAVLVGFPAAEKYLRFDGHPSKIYVRTVNTPAATTAVDGLLGYQANPEPAGHPGRAPATHPGAVEHLTERGVADFRIVLPAALVQLAGEVDDLLASHRLLTRPLARRLLAPGAMPG